jgi:hypothetical protein
MKEKQIVKIGQRFGRLVVVNTLDNVEPNGKKYKHAHCICDCGNETKVRIGSLFLHTKSCGCIRRENISARKHGRSKTLLYYVFTNIKNRCYYKPHKSYKDYGGRGITVCDEWLKHPELFYSWAEDNGYKKGLTIERIDNNKGYSPDNCIFVDRFVQCNNKSNNHIIEFNNEKMTMMQFCRKYDINYNLFESRIRNKKTVFESMQNCGKYKHKYQKRETVLC